MPCPNLEIILLFVTRKKLGPYKRVALYTVKLVNRLGSLRPSLFMSELNTSMGTTLTRGMFFSKKRSNMNSPAVKLS